MYITLVADGSGGGWAFGPRLHATPARVQPGELPHVTLPLCDPASRDAFTVARSTVSLDAVTTAAFTAGAQPPTAELQQPAVLLAALPQHRLAVAVGVFTDTYAAHQWWAANRTRINLPDITISVYPLINATPPRQG
jgi:hypothetical protein